MIFEAKTSSLSLVVAGLAMLDSETVERARCDGAGPTSIGGAVFNQCLPSSSHSGMCAFLSTAYQHAKLSTSDEEISCVMLLVGHSSHGVIGQ